MLTATRGLQVDHHGRAQAAQAVCAAPRGGTHTRGVRTRALGEEREREAAGGAKRCSSGACEPGLTHSPLPHTMQVAQWKELLERAREDALYLHPRDRSAALHGTHPPHLLTSVQTTSGCIMSAMVRSTDTTHQAPRKAPPRSTRNTAHGPYPRHALTVWALTLTVDGVLTSTESGGESMPTSPTSTVEHQPRWKEAGPAGGVPEVRELPAEPCSVPRDDTAPSTGRDAEGDGGAAQGASPPLYIPTRPTACVCYTERPHVRTL